MNAPEPKRTETDVAPTDIQRDGDAVIVIRWSDDTSTQWTASELRKACPCATCREKKRDDEAVKTSSTGPMLLPILSAAEARPLRIESMRPVGSYAYNIAFSDGHSSGIFPFVLLHDGISLD
ncbi:MAG: DUF971 domain-containing protein [Pirellulaceae bacterium]